MMTNLDIFLESIHPARTLDVLATRGDQALNTFNPGPGAITDGLKPQGMLRRLHHVGR